MVPIKIALAEIITTGVTAAAIADIVVCAACTVCAEFTCMFTLVERL